MILGCSQLQKPHVSLPHILPHVLGRLRNWAPVPEVGCSQGDEEVTCPVIPGHSQLQKPHVCLPHILGEMEEPGPSA